MAAVRETARRLLAIAAAGALVQLVNAAVVRAVVHYALRRLRAGDPTALLRLYAKDARFVFPGSSSWAVDTTSRDEIQRWWRSFARVGFQLEAHEIVVAGPPWRTTVCMQFTDQIFDAGERVYANDGAMVAVSSWGLIREQRIYEDTQRGARLDVWMAEHRPELARAA